MGNTAIFVCPQISKFFHSSKTEDFDINMSCLVSKYSPKKDLPYCVVVTEQLAVPAVLLTSNVSLILSAYTCGGPRFVATFCGHFERKMSDIFPQDILKILDFKRFKSVFA